MTYLPRKVNQLLEAAFVRVVGQLPAGRTRDFIRNIGITGVATLCTGALGVVSSALIGRLLGPTEFGRYNVVNSLSQFLVIPLTLGVHTALTQALPRSSNAQRTVASATPLLAFGFIISATVYTIALPQWAKLLQIPSHIFLLAFLLAMAMAMRYVIDSILRGRGGFATSAKLEVFTAASSFALLVFFVARHSQQADIYLAILMCGALIYATGGYFTVRKSFGWKVTAETKQLLLYGAFTLLISGGQMFLQQADRLVMHYVRGDSAVGIYSAYLSGAMFATAFLFSILNYVLLPMSSAMADITVVYQRVRRHRVQLIGGVSAVAMIVTYLFIRVLGNSYPLYWGWIVLAGLQAGIYFYANLLLVLAFSRGRLFLRRILRYVLAAAVLFLVAAIYFATWWGVPGLFGALIIAYGFLAVAISRELKYNTVMSI